MMKEDDIGAMPIGENDRLIGMVTDRDLALRTLANGSKYPAARTARDVMTKKKWSPPTRRPTHLFQETFS